MTTYIALLRGVNVGGNKKVSMADLRDLIARLGLKDGRTLLQSGNLVFRSDKRPEQLERLLEAEVEKRLALQTVFFVRTAKELAAVVAKNPFPEEAERDPGHLLVQFLMDEPETKAVEALQASIRGPEVIRADGRHAYMVYPDGVGRSPVINALIERNLGTRCTGRNWNTVLKLVALANT